MVGTRFGRGDGYRDRTRVCALAVKGKLNKLNTFSEKIKIILKLCTLFRPAKGYWAYLISTIPTMIESWHFVSWIKKLKAEYKNYIYIYIYIYV